MKALLQHPLFQLLAALAVGGLLGWLLTRNPAPAPPLMTKAQQRAAIQQAAAAQVAAARLRAKADTTTARAAAPYAAGKAAEQQALILHAQTHAKRKPLPVGAHHRPAAIDSLTRFLTNY